MPLRRSIERLIADTRVIASILLCLVVAKPAGLFDEPALVLLTALYAVHAMAVALLVRWKPELLLRTAGTLHLVDLAWAVTAVIATGVDVGGHFFPLCAFAIAAAAYRSGFRSALLEGALIFAAIMATYVAAAHVPSTTATRASTLWLLQGGYVSGAAVLFGTIASRLHAAAFESATLAHLVRKIEHTPNLDEAVLDTLAEVLRVVDASHAVLAAVESDTRTLVVWRADVRPQGEVAVAREALDRKDVQQWIAPLDPKVAAFELRRRDGAAEEDCGSLALDVDGNLAHGRLPVPGQIARQWSWRVALGAVLECEGFWSGRLYVFDPSGPLRGDLRLHFLHTVVERATPPMLNLYLQRRLRSRAESIERARIARELHDGAVQSLSGLEMRLDVLAHRSTGVSPWIEREIATIRDLLHDEALRLRELMVGLRSSEITPRRLPGELRDQIERFAAITHIDARLVWAAGSLELTPHACQEVLRIVQEGLVNVRRHSGAEGVIVRVEADASAWALIIEDNGGGLGFTGRLTHAELEEQAKGPRIIRERVAALGGTLSVDSSPEGARLEMVFPTTN